MRALAPALMMSVLVGGPATVFAQQLCDPCQAVAAAISPPAAYYYPVPYAAPTYYVYTPPVYYVPTYYVPVAAPAPVSPPVTDDYQGELPQSRSTGSGTTTGRVRVYSRIVNSARRSTTGAQFGQFGEATDHASMVANGFSLVNQYATVVPVDPGVNAAQTQRLRAAASQMLANLAIAEAQKNTSRQPRPARANNAPRKQSDCATKEELQIAIDELSRQIANPSGLGPPSAVGPAPAKTQQPQQPQKPQQPANVPKKG